MCSMESCNTSCNSVIFLFERFHENAMDMNIVLILIAINY